MGRTTSRKRPWLAALLAALVTGFGHLYLRRWRRAFGWFTALVVAAVLFVDPAAFKALANGSPVGLLAQLPLLVVGTLSVLDAYFLAHVQNHVVRTVTPQEEERTHCPNCGKELDTEIEFCHWCTTPLAEFEEPGTGRAER